MVKEKIAAGMLILTLLTVYCTGCRSISTGEKNDQNQAVSAIQGNVEAGIRITLQDGNIVSDNDQVAVSDNIIRITEAGTYVFTGTLSDGRIVVEAGKEDDIELILNGVDIACSTYSPIQILQAGAVTIDLAENSENRLSDGECYELIDEEDNTDAVIFSKDDLKLKGSGILSICGNYKHGIVCKDDLTIKDGTYYIQSVEDGMNANDSIIIDGGTFFITTGDDGIHVDETLTINGSKIAIQESKEGLEGHQVIINDGEIDITASDDGINSNCGADSENKLRWENAEDQGMPTGNDMSDNVPVRPGVGNEDAPEPPAGGIQNRGNEDGGKSPEPSELPEGGMPNHGNDEGGEVLQPPELPEGEMLESGMSMDTDADSLIQINGGTIIVNAGGDGLDSNGVLEINGGTSYISGAANGGDAAIDYGISGILNGGTIVAVGYSNMAEGFSDISTQHYVLFYTKDIQDGGSTLALKDTDENELISWQPVKEYNSVLISTPNMENDKDYVLSVNGIAVESVNK